MTAGISTSRTFIAPSAMLKSQTIWEIEDKISANLSEKEKEIMRSTEVSGLESSSFRFELVTVNAAEKSWTSIEVHSIALEPRDRLSGSVVHGPRGRCDGIPLRPMQTWERRRSCEQRPCILCAGAELRRVWEQE